MTDPKEFSGQKVLIVGGGDSAFDWTHQLMDHADIGDARSIGAIGFGRTDPTVAAVSDAAKAGRVKVLTFHEIADVHGNGMGA